MPVLRLEAAARWTSMLQGWRRWLLCLAAGAVLVLTLAPFDQLWAGFLAFPPLVWLLQGTASIAGWRRRVFQAFLSGWWFGLGYFAGGLWWIGNALLVEAEEFAWAVPFAVLALPAFLSLFYGLATLIAGIGRGSALACIIALTAGFGLAEWLRTFLFTGFPWNPIGHAIMPSPIFMQPVALLGSGMMNMLAVLLFSLPALLSERGRAPAAVLAPALLLAAMAAFGVWRLSLPDSGAEPVRARIVQASIDQAEKWNAQTRDRIFRRHLELSAAHGNEIAPELVIWPETAVPFLFSENPEALREIARTLQPDQHLLAGAVRDQPDPASPYGRRFYNSLLVIDSAGNIVSAADKVHLVPFGEYLPLSGWLEALGLRQLVQAPGVFSAAERREILKIGRINLLPLICYEIIFAEEVNSSAFGAGIIVNITNDAWYGDTPGPYQHLRQAQVRAVETGLPVIRAANNGISASIDSRGRINTSLALNQVGSIDASLVPGRFPDVSKRGIVFAAVLFLFFAVAAAMHVYFRSPAN